MGIWSALAVLVKIISMVLIFAIVIMAFWPVIQESHARSQELLRKEHLLAAAEAEERRLTKEIELIKTSTTYVEQLARDTLRMGKPGEVIYYFDPYKVAATANSGGAKAP